jgi:ATP/maltotriose-dependent transcriptional regulator MalT
MPLKRSGIRDQVCDFNLDGIASQASEMGQISAKPDKANVGLRAGSLRSPTGICRGVGLRNRYTVVDSKPEFSARFGCFGHEIHTLIAQGRSNKEIARTLSIAPKTVKTHMKHIFNKLNVTRGAGLFARTKSWARHRIACVTSLLMSAVKRCHFVPINSP